MTTYTAITDTETGFEKPVTISLMRRLRDNPLAIQEGDATAPSLYVGIAAKHSSGGLGGVAMLSSNTLINVTAGTSYAGSNFVFGGLESASGAAPYAAEINLSATVPSGTWKALCTLSGTGAVCGIFIRTA